MGMRGRLAITGARTEHPCRGLVRALGVAFAAAMALGPWRAALAAPKSFDIATTDAPAALAQFGRQSGREILFEYDLISGQQTHPIAGDYEPIEALRRMTAGTKLRVTESADGVLVVECSCAKAARAAAPEGGAPSSTTSAVPLPANSARSGLGRSG